MAGERMRLDGLCSFHNFNAAYGAASLLRTPQMEIGRLQPSKQPTSVLAQVSRNIMGAAGDQDGSSWRRGVARAHVPSLDGAAAELMRRRS